MNRNLLRSLALATGGLAAAASAVSAAEVLVSANITADTIWTSDNQYILNGVIYVANGATLTIQPGTVIRGRPDSLTPGANDPGSLIVTRGSKIYALGSPTAPIVMTDLFDDNFVGGGTPSADYATWSPENVAAYGSLIVLGGASINGGSESLVGTGTIRNFGNNQQVEGVVGDQAVYGGLDDDDSSGAIRYLSIRYSGFGLSSNSEINGLTLGGVGRGTQIEYIDVINNIDDGVEIFGGTVNLKYVALWAPGDDAFDLDQGWRGKVQYLFIVQGVTTDSAIGSGRSDKIAEMDGGLGGGDGTHPYTIPTVYNVTAVGLGSDKNYALNASTGPSGNLGLVFRDNAGGRWYNGLYLDIGGMPVIVEDVSGSTLDSATRATTPYSSYPDPTVAAQVVGGTTFTYPAGKPATYWYRDLASAPAGANQLALDHNVFAAIGGLDGNPATTATWADAIASDNASIVARYPEGGHSGGSTALAVVSASANNVLLGNAAVTDLIRGFARTENGIPTRANPVTFIDPRPRVDGPHGTLLTSGLTAPADGFFDPVSYKGAFSPSTNWLLGWSTPYLLGLFGEEPTGFPGRPDAVVAAVSQPLATVEIRDTLLGKVYVVASSATVDGTYTVVGSVGGNGGTVTFVDTRELPTQQFYTVYEQ